MNNNQFKKKIGTREEVYLGIALKTKGGLFKKDIIQKNINGKYSYISKKLSEIAKERDVFSNYRKRKTKGKMNSSTMNNTVSNSVINAISNNQNRNTSNISQVNKLTKKNVSFKLNQNTYKSIYYPELKGVNLERLRRDNLEEEDEDYDDDELDGEIQHTPKNFEIEDISQLNL